jgi:ATP-dependent DNA helicase RecG
VGIDVPNATVMIIVDADRFGLSQLHQLRGRVGRGTHSSYCILLADPKTDDGVARMKVMTETNDGFRIAEEDLNLRGPGEFLGTKQSGMPEFRFGNLLMDKEIMEQAKRMAFDLIHADPNLEHPEHAGLKSEIRRKSQAFELMHVS